MYQMQLLQFSRDLHGIAHKTWKNIRPGGQVGPYQYETPGEAIRMIQMCYPDVNPDHLRVVKVDPQKGTEEVVWPVHLLKQQE